MRARITSDHFFGVKDGEIYPQDHLKDEEVEGDLARAAVEAGNAEIVEDDTDEQRKVAAAPKRRLKQPMPPTPNNPPSPAALGQAGLPPQPAAKSTPTPGTETAIPAAAAKDGGASTVKGPDTPSGGKQGEDPSAEAAAADLKGKAEAGSPENKSRR